MFKDKVCCKIHEESIPVATRTDPDSLNTHSNANLINHKNCGISTNSYRIMSGSEVMVGEYPWMSLLMFRSNVGDDKVYFGCGGSLITSKHVLTAAHCLNMQGSTL